MCMIFVLQACVKGVLQADVLSSVIDFTQVGIIDTNPTIRAIEWIFQLREEFII